MTTGLVSINAQDTPESIVELFFETLEQEGVAIALDTLYQTNPWMDRNLDGINNVKTQLERFEDKDLVGDYYGYEKITSQYLGSSYVLYVYFLKFDRQFLRLSFHIYKPKDTWRLYSFQFDDNYDDELKDASILYHLYNTNY